MSARLVVVCAVVSMCLSVARAQILPTDGILVSRSRIQGTSGSGAAFDLVTYWAGMSIISAHSEIGNQNSDNSAIALAKALLYVFDSTNLTYQGYRNHVIDAIRVIFSTPPDDLNWSVLAPSRELCAYVVAADLLVLSDVDKDSFKSWLETAVYETVYRGGMDPELTIEEAHRYRPQNFGGHAGATRLATAVYRGDVADVQKCWRVFRQFCGHTNLLPPDEFDFGSDISWHPEGSTSSTWVPINPAGSYIIDYSMGFPGVNRDVDGCQPDEQRRAGSFAWPPTWTKYHFEGLQGLWAQALILSRCQYSPFTVKSDAISRAMDFYYRNGMDIDPLAANPRGDDSQDDVWMEPLSNHFYGTSYYWIVDTTYTDYRNNKPGKAIGFMEWLYP